MTRCFLIPAIAFLTPPALAQTPTELPTAEEYSERAEAAENAPLFRSRAPIRMTLRTDIEWLRDERSDSVEVDGTVTFFDEDLAELVRPVEVRARGNFRRDKKNCNFPPLRLDFPTRQMEGTVFEGQNRLKLVTPCNDGRDDYQRYIYLEYLVYEVFRVLTPAGFRARLVEITYEDIEGDYDTRTKIGFLIEDNEQMAARNRATLFEVDEFHPGRTEGEQSVLVAVFNYMIGNTDWSAAYFHNVELIYTDDHRYITVPYDFDFSGAVDARYARPPDGLPIRRVTDRLFRGFCRPELEREPIAEVFNSHRQEIRELYTGFERLERDDVEDALEFYEEFYEVISDDRKFGREILEVCRNW